MAFRSTESPMDFEWNTGHGPIDSTSPFLQRPQSNTMQSSSGTTARKRGNHFSTNAQVPDKLIGLTGSFRDFESPQKAVLPGQSSFTCNSPYSNPPPSTPSAKPAHLQLRQSSFTTPQRSFDLDFSSGLENESSPGADNEDTPEQPQRQIVQFSGNHQSPKRASPVKSQFTPLHTPGRGEIIRRPHHDAIRRVNKKRRRDADRDVRSAVKRHYSDSSDSSNASAHHHSQSHQTRQAQHTQQMGVIPSILSFIDAHPHLPATLSYYAQFLLNLFVVLVIIYAVTAICLSIREDFQKASSLASSEMMAEMAACASEYRENNCKDVSARVPAMRSVCESWERCMSRDPRMVGRAKVSARTFAEILSSFVDGVSVKAMGLGGALFIGCWAVGNLSLSWVRAKADASVGGYPQSYDGHGGRDGFTGHGQMQGYMNEDWRERRFGGFQGNSMASGMQESPMKGLEGRSPVKKLELR